MNVRPLDRQDLVALLELARNAKNRDPELVVLGVDLIERLIAAEDTVARVRAALAVPHIAAYDMRQDILVALGDAP